MYKGVKLLSITALICILLTGALCLMTKPVSTELSGKDDTDAPLLIDDIHLSSVAGIVLKNGNGSVPLMIYDGEFQYLDFPGDTEINSSVLKAFAYRMVHMPAKEKLGELSDISGFGLDEPISTVSVILTNGETLRISLGNEAPFQGGYYVKADNDPNIWLVDDITARMLMYSVDDFRKTDVLPELPAEISLKDLTYFALIHRNNIIEIAGNAGSNGISYSMLQPFEAALDWENVASLVYSPLSCLTECTFVSADGNYADYGFLDRNVYTLIITISGKTSQLYFCPAEDGSFYVCRDGSKQIIQVRPEFLSFLKLRVSDLVSDTLYSVSAANLASVRFEADGMDLTVKISGIGEDLCAHVGNKTMTASETVSFVKGAALIPQAGELTEETEITEAPVLRLTFRLRDGEENIVEFIPITDWHCAVIIDGTASAATFTSAVGEIINEVKACTAGN